MFVSDVCNLDRNSCVLLVDSLDVWQSYGLCVRLEPSAWSFPPQLTPIQACRPDTQRVPRGVASAARGGGNVLPDRSNELLSFFKRRMKSHKLSGCGGGVS